MPLFWFIAQLTSRCFIRRIFLVISGAAASWCRQLKWIIILSLAKGITKKNERYERMRARFKQIRLLGRLTCGGKEARREKRISWCHWDGRMGWCNVEGGGRLLFPNGLSRFSHGWEIRRDQRESRGLKEADIQGNNIGKQYSPTSYCKHIKIDFDLLKNSITVFFLPDYNSRVLFFPSRVDFACMWNFNFKGEVQLCLSFQFG